MIESIAEWSDLAKLVWTLILIGGAMLGLIYSNWTTKRDTKDNITKIGEVKQTTLDIKKEVTVVKEDIQGVKSDITIREAKIRSDTISGMEKIKEAQNQQIALMHELHRTTMDKIADIAVKAAEK